MPAAVDLGIRQDQDSSHHIHECHLDRLKGKRVVFVSPGYPGKRFIFERAFELGVLSIVLDSPGSWTAELFRQGIVHRVVFVDMSNSNEKVLQESISALSGIEGFDAICTFVELSALLTARLCEHFNVPGHSVGSVELARDKHLTRKAVSSTGETLQYVIRSRLIEKGTKSELAEAADFVGFPAVLKPVSGAASLGVRKVARFEELLESYSQIQDLLSDLVVSNGALERRLRMQSGDVFDVCKSNCYSSSIGNTRILLEEYISGEEVDIDMVLCDGNVTFCEVSDNGPTIEPYFGETYNSCPSLLSEKDQEELKQMAFLVATRALGFHSGVFHVEGKMTLTGPLLVEVNCRMGGGPIRSVHMARSGVDLVEEQLLLACGIPTIPLALSSEGQVAVGFIDVNARRSGSVASLDFLRQFNQRKGMLYCKSMVTAGEHIVGPEEGQPSWLAEAVFLCDTPEDAHSASLTLYTEIQTLFEKHYVPSP